MGVDDATVRKTGPVLEQIPIDWDEIGWLHPATFDRLRGHLSFGKRDEEGTVGFRTRVSSDGRELLLVLEANC